MIISQTPYRVSFAGGGTDLPAYYRWEFGAVLSVKIEILIPVPRWKRITLLLNVVPIALVIADDIGKSLLSHVSEKSK
jgi:D-glycero-alpha-D-manno-heptose-7-phosphate kinase